MNPTQSGFKISIGHRLTAECDGRGVPLSPFQEAVLVVLADAGRDGLSRDRVIALVWGDDDGPKARQRLRQILYSIGRKADREVVKTDGPHLTLSVEVAVDWVDGAAEYRSPIESGALEHWLDGVRVRVGQRRGDCLRRALLKMVEAARWEDALKVAKDWIAEFPDSAEAVKQVANLEQASRIRRGPPFMAFDPPRTVGRESETSHLAEVLRAGDSVFLDGEAGLGKTRIARAVETRLVAEGVQVFWVDCGGGRRSPGFGPLPEILRLGLTANDIAATASAALTELLLEGDNSSARPLESLVDGIVAGFGILSALEPIVVIIDDFHFADPFTNAAVSSISATCRNCQFFLIERPQPSVEYDCVPSGFLRIRLGPLTSDAIRELWTQLDATELSNPSQVGGNPLLAIELVRRNARTLQRSDDPSTTFDPIIGGLGVDEAGALLLVRLDPGVATNQIAQDLRVSVPRAAASVQALSNLGLVVRDDGFRVRHGVFQEVIDRVIPIEMRIAIHEVLAQRLRGVAGRHAEQLFHEAMVDPRSTAPLRALEIAGGSTLGARPNEQERLARIAALSHSPQVAAKGHLMLGEILIRTRSITRGIQHLRTVGELLPFSDPSAFRSRTLLFSLEAELGLRDPVEAISELRPRGFSPDKLTDHEVDALEQCVRLAERSGRVEIAAEILEELPDRDENLPPRTLWGVLMLRALHVIYGTPQIGIEAARKAALVARELADEELELRGAHRLFIGLMYQGWGDSAEAISALEILSKGRSRLPDHRWQYTAIANQAVWLIDTCRYELAAVKLAEAAAAIEGMDAPDEQLNLLLNRAELALRSGEFAEAFTLFQTARNVSGRGARSFLADVISAGIGISALELGHLTIARQQRIYRSPYEVWTADLVLPTLFLAMGQHRSGHSNEALSTFQRAQRAAERFVPQRLFLMTQERLLRQKCGISDPQLEGRIAAVVEATGLPAPYSAS